MSIKKAKLNDLDKKSKIDKILDAIERGGNALPHPFILFCLLTVIFLVLSWLLAKMGVTLSVLSATTDGTGSVEKIITATNLINTEYLINLIITFPQTFINFGPLKMALVVIVSIAVAEKSGLLSAFVRRVLLKTSPTWLLIITTFIAVNGNLLADVAVVVLPPLAGATFAAMGFNPWLGITLAFIGATAANSATVVITSNDINLAGVTQSVTESLGINAPTDPLMNWYFILVSTFLITAVCVVVSKTVMKNKLPMCDPNANLIGDGSKLVQDSQLKESEIRALRWTGVFSVLYFISIALMTIPKTGILRSPEGTILPSSPFLSGLVMIISLYFVFAGIVYGRVSGNMKSIQELPDLMASGINNLAGFIVIIIGASLMLKVFADSHIGDLIGGAGGVLLQKFDIGALPALIGLIVVAMLANLFVISGLTKWILFAPVFIPLLAAINVSPAAVQMAYRIGDAITNSISPMNAMLGAIIGYYTLWKPKGYGKVGMGTIIVLAFPYTVAIGIVLILQFILWMVFKLPLGPGANIYF